jgi:hypothetical protein
MADTNKKKILRLIISGAETSQSSKEKLEFLRLGVLLLGIKLPKNLTEIPEDMQKLLGL